MPTARPNQTRSADPLDFTGERDRPALPEELARREPIRATAKPPPEFVEHRSRRRLLVSSAGRDKPRVTVEKRETRRSRTLWQVDIHYPEEHDPSEAMYARRLERVAPESILREIDPHIGFSSYRPPWVGVSFTPPVLPRDYPPMRRFNGRLVDPLMIFPPDGRQPYHPTSFPWSLVGKIFDNRGKEGSAALVGRNIIVTAGHAVPWSDTEEGWIRFVPSCYGNVSWYGYGCESFVEEAKGWDVAPDVTGYDWAVCKLYEPLGDWLGYFGCNTYSDAHEDEACWTILGYPLDIANRKKPCAQTGVSVFDDDGDKHGGRE